MKRIFVAAFAALALAAQTSLVHAQRVSGTVLTADNGTPVAGAIVSAFAGRDTVAAVLARADGRFYLTLPEQRNMTLLVRAIGMRPVQMPIRGGIDTVVSVKMIRITYTLQSVNVLGLTECLKSQTGTSDIVDVWLEVTKALENTRVARDSALRRFHYVMVEKQTDLATGRERLLRSDSSSWVAARPFRVTPPRDLAADGYVIQVEPSPRNRYRRGDFWYRGPDEMVLLDASFQSSHCFWASHGVGENLNMIGVHFMPVTGIRINDIRGVFWIDARSYELRRLDYVYTQIVPAAVQRALAENDSALAAANMMVRPALRNPEPGGVIEFMSLPDGSFIIPRWSIFVNDTWTPRAELGTPLRTPLIGKETSGTVVGIGGRR